MNYLQSFVSNRKAVKVASTLTLIGLSVHFFFIGILEKDLVADILALDNYTLYRIWYIVFGLGLLLVGYASYVQNKALVNESLSKAKAKVSEEASNLADQVKEIDVNGKDETEPKKKVAKK